MKTNKTSVFTAVCIVLILIIVAYFAWQSYVNHGNYGEESDIAQTLADESTVYTDVRGNKVDLSLYKGKPLVVNLWATWTPFSRDELLHLSELSKEYGEQINILAINRSEQLPKAESYLESLGLDGNITFLYDHDDAFYNSVGGHAMPETLFYDTKGNVLIHKRGSMTQKEMQEHIESLIQAAETK